MQYETNPESKLQQIQVVTLLKKCRNIWTDSQGTDRSIWQELVPWHKGDYGYITSKQSGKGTAEVKKYENRKMQANKIGAYAVVPVKIVPISNRCVKKMQYFCLWIF
jgi:hypothetical protein